MHCPTESLKEAANKVLAKKVPEVDKDEYNEKVGRYCRHIGKHFLGFIEDLVNLDQSSKEDIPEQEIYNPTAVRFRGDVRPIRGPYGTPYEKFNSGLGCQFSYTTKDDHYGPHDTDNKIILQVQTNGDFVVYCTTGSTLSDRDSEKSRYHQGPGQRDAISSLAGWLGLVAPERSEEIGELLKKRVQQMDQEEALSKVMKSKSTLKS